MFDLITNRVAGETRGRRHGGECAGDCAVPADEPEGGGDEMQG